MNWPDVTGKVIALDTETTGLTDKDRPVGASLSYDDQDCYFAWGHPEQNSCSLTEFKAWANDAVKRAEVVVMHNGPFDMRMLSYVDVDPLHWPVEDTGTVCALLNELEPSFELDKLSLKYTGKSKSDDELNQWCADHFGGAATRNAQAKNYHRAPGRIVAPYAKGDSRMTLDLYKARRPLLKDEGLESVYALELLQLPIVLKMHRVGVRIDQRQAVALRDDLLRKHTVLDRWLEHMAPGVNFNSTPQLAALFDTLGIPYLYTEAGNPSITKELLNELAATGKYEFPSKLVEYRQLKHYANTFIQSYLLDNIRDTGTVHGEFHPIKRDKYGTVSGRYSSGGGLNLQNIPARDPFWAPMIRGLYIPYSPDHDWDRYDYSQIEYRYLAHYAGGKLRQAYQGNPDIDFHQMVSDMSGMDRKPAKNLNFAVVYGQGVNATMAQLGGLSREKTLEFLRQYHSAVPEAKRLMNRAMNVAAQRGYIITWGGRRRRFRKKDSGGYQSLHKALNALLQGSAADLMKKAMVAVDEVIDWQDAILHLTVHDELDLSITRGETGDTYRRQIKEAMEDFDLSVPIKAVHERGTDWGHVVEA